MSTCIECGGPTNRENYICGSCKDADTIADLKDKVKELEQWKYNTQNHDPYSAALGELHTQIAKLEKWKDDVIAELPNYKLNGSDAADQIRGMISDEENTTTLMRKYKAEADTLKSEAETRKIMISAAEKVRDVYMKGDADAVMTAIGEMRSVWTRATLGQELPPGKYNIPKIDPLLCRESMEAMVAAEKELNQDNAGKTYQPEGDTFFDAASGREMLLASEGSFSGWLCFKHPDGQWVTLRKATEEDLQKIEEAKADGQKEN